MIQKHTSAGDVNLHYKMHSDIVYINLNLIPHIVYNEYIQ